MNRGFLAAALAAGAMAAASGAKAQNDMNIRNMTPPSPLCQAAEQPAGKRAIQNNELGDPTQFCPSPVSHSVMVWAAPAQQPEYETVKPSQAFIHSKAVGEVFQIASVDPRTNHAKFEIQKALYTSHAVQYAKAKNDPYDCTLVNVPNQFDKKAPPTVGVICKDELLAVTAPSRVLTGQWAYGASTVMGSQHPLTTLLLVGPR